MSTIVTAPWRPDEVEALNKYQKSGVMHEFTCKEHSHEVLIATIDGWICPHQFCYYAQDWAWDWMINVGKDQKDE